MGSGARGGSSGASLWNPVPTEAVLEHPDQVPEGHEQLAFLRGQFSIAELDLLEGSYGEMVEQAGE